MLAPAAIRDRWRHFDTKFQKSTFETRTPPDLELPTQIRCSTLEMASVAFPSFTVYLSP